MTDQSIFWVEVAYPGRIAVVTRPRSVTHFRVLKAAGIDVLVSLLDPDEAESMGLAGEAGHCARADIEFISLPVIDHGIPATFEMIEETVARLKLRLRTGRGVGAHCFAGLGRSPLLVAAVLIRHGHSDGEATQLVSAARGYPVPEMDSQRTWLAEFAMRG